jgi:hypothetical protein
MATNFFIYDSTTSSYKDLNTILQKRASAATSKTNFIVGSSNTDLGSLLQTYDNTSTKANSTRLYFGGVDLVNSFQKIPPYLTPTNIMYAFSVRLIISSYNGPIFTLRRGTGGQTSDFYTDSTQSYLSTGINNTGTSYSTWSSGGGTIYVTKWYDQSGKGNHATQTTTANQPTLVLQTSKYILRFAAANSTYISLTTASQPNTIFCSFSCDSVGTGTFGTIISASGDYGQRNFSGSITNGNANDWYYSQSGTKYAYNNGAAATTITSGTWNCLALTTDSKVYSTSGITNATFVNIGTDGYDKVARGLTGYMSEMIGHNTTMATTDLTAFYTNRILF